MNEGSVSGRSLLFRAGSLLCAIGLEDVIETMRPLPEVPLAGMPPFVRGVAVIRGVPTPVVDARTVLGIQEGSEPARFVTLKAGTRTVALAVDEVIGVRDLSSTAAAELPPLLREAGAEAVAAIAAIGRLDAELLFVLRGARQVPESVWLAMAASGDRG